MPAPGRNPVGVPGHPPGAHRPPTSSAPILPRTLSHALEVRQASRPPTGRLAGPGLPGDPGPRDRRPRASRRRSLVREVRGVDGRAIPLVPSKGGATAVVFYSTECPISNEYSPILKAIAESQSSAGSAMVGVCVDPDLSTADVAKHAKEFGLKFPIALDRDGSIAARFGTKVTPEAFVLDADGKVRYRGRIDDTYAARGKRKANPHDQRPRRTPSPPSSPGGRRRRPRRGRSAARSPSVPRSPLKPTFAKDVAPILQKNCQQCHRPGQVGPFSLVTYEQARKRADDIADQVVDRKMPPWKPDPDRRPRLQALQGALDRGRDRHHRRLGRGRSPRGRPGRHAPAPGLSATAGPWATPDLILEASEDFAIPAEGGDIYRCFVIPTSLPERQVHLGDRVPSGQPEGRPPRPGLC